MALGACTVDMTEEVSTETSEAQTTNRLSSNRLSSNHLAAAKLAAGPIGQLAGPLASTTDGREVLSYIVGCALDDDDTLWVNGVAFPGSLGLAPQWSKRPLTPAERGWVSACVFARTNAYGVMVPLSLRGNHPQLAAPLGEVLGNLLLEGAFWGDLFDPTGMKAYACSGLLKETKLPLSTLPSRACAEPLHAGDTTTGCGFQYMGPCGVVDLGLAAACGSLLAPYSNCKEAAGARSREVITVWLGTAL